MACSKDAKFQKGKTDSTAEHSDEQNNLGHAEARKESRPGAWKPQAHTMWHIVCCKDTSTIRPRGAAGCMLCDAAQDTQKPDAPLCRSPHIPGMLRGCSLCWLSPLTRAPRGALQMASCSSPGPGRSTRAAAPLRLQRHVQSLKDSMDAAGMNCIARPARFSSLPLLNAIDQRSPDDAGNLSVARPAAGSADLAS
jgi:hypothetical protein